jgi:hypothetical protein
MSRNIILILRRKKSLLETHRHFVVDTFSQLERARQDNSNVIMKGCTTTLKMVACTVRETTQKANHIKYNEVSI